ncbi:MAG: PEP-CTERM sorting domain-containing protein [Verrucomicrobiae bacterium]|nr:PEP-CTERM sorting domain-containing protein [Verrucomicrobiae bacterium]
MREKPFITPAAKAAALAGGALAAAQSANAAIVAALNTPISPGYGSSGSWDVDGDGNNDFRLQAIIGSGPSAMVTELGPARFVAPGALSNDGFAKLDASFVVGPTLVTGFKFFALPQSEIRLTYKGYIGPDGNANGWELGDAGYFGFKFTNVSGAHYGWGQIEIEGDPVGGIGFTILAAYYDDTANAPIAVGAIPEPSQVALLALGAAGVAAWRRRRLTGESK